MKSIVVNLFFFIIIFMFYGCNKENSIQTAMVEYDGIVLYSNDDGLHYFGKISETDNLFKIYSNRPLSRVGVNSVICIDNNGKPEIEGYWGNITLSQNNNLYLYQIHIKSNNSGKDRYFELKFGSGETFCIVNVLQQYCL